MSWTSLDLAYYVMPTILGVPYSEHEPEFYEKIYYNLQQGARDVIFTNPVTSNHFYASALYIDCVPSYELIQEMWQLKAPEVSVGTHLRCHQFLFAGITTLRTGGIHLFNGSYMRRFSNFIDNLGEKRESWSICPLHLYTGVSMIDSMLSTLLNAIYTRYVSSEDISANPHTWSESEEYALNEIVHVLPVVLKVIDEVLRSLRNCSIRDSHVDVLRCRKYIRALCNHYSKSINANKIQLLHEMSLQIKNDDYELSIDTNLRTFMESPGVSNAPKMLAAPGNNETVSEQLLRFRKENYEQLLSIRNSIAPLMCVFAVSILVFISNLLLDTRLTYVLCPWQRNFIFTFMILGFVCALVAYSPFNIKLKKVNIVFRDKHNLGFSSVEKQAQYEKGGIYISDMLRQASYSEINEPSSHDKDNANAVIYIAKQIVSRRAWMGLSFVFYSIALFMLVFLIWSAIS